MYLNPKYTIVKDNQEVTTKVWQSTSKVFLCSRKCQCTVDTCENAPEVDKRAETVHSCNIRKWWGSVDQACKDPMVDRGFDSLCLVWWVQKDGLCSLLLKRSHSVILNTSTHPFILNQTRSQTWSHKLQSQAWEHSWLMPTQFSFSQRKCYWFDFGGARKG